jgi:hypothetical protein
MSTSSNPVITPNKDNIEIPPVALAQRLGQAATEVEK